jgi:adenylate kinase family enzyme
VIELVVDDTALVRPDREAGRRKARAAGQPVRRDDTPEVFEVRLREYYKNTAPLIGYYWPRAIWCRSTAWPGCRPLPRPSPKFLTKPEKSLSRP